MSNTDNTETKNLESLIGQYRGTNAPLGFTNRVMAQVEQDKKGQAFLSPGFAVATSVSIVALVAVVIVNSIEDKKPELQIAIQDQPTQITTPVPEREPVQNETGNKTQKEEPVPLPAREPETVVASASKPVEPQIQTQTTVKISTEERELFFQASNDTDSTSLAVLTDVSDWLTEQKDMTAPDISDLPDMGEIDSLFDTT